MSNPSPLPWSVHPMTERLGELHQVTPQDGSEPFMCASIWIGSGDTILAQMSFHSPSKGYPTPTLVEMRANARLAIAAPTLLEACKRALALLEDPGSDEFDANMVESDLRDAIRSATWEIP